MTRIIRFGVSLEKELSDKFDRLIREKNYTNRSEALRDLIRKELINKEWQENKTITGAIILVYNHHKRELVTWLLNIQHDYHNNILSTQHLHLDEENCLEIIAIKGKAKRTEELYTKLKSAKGVKHADFAISTTGKKLL